MVSLDAGNSSEHSMLLSRCRLADSYIHTVRSTLHDGKEAYVVVHCARVYICFFGPIIWVPGLISPDEVRIGQI